MKPLRIVADAHAWGAADAFSRIPGHDVTLRLLEATEITSAAVRDADALIVRSSLRVDADLLAGSRVRFVATATIGHDHLDTRWLEAQGIAWANAAGSSTDAVVEYMLTALLELHAQGRIRLPDVRIGIIGAGRIGGALARILRRLGMTPLICDPPRARREGQVGFLPLTRLLTDAEVLTLHTPLTHEGRDATFHLLDEARLSAFQGAGVINAARGGCVDNAALEAWLDGDARRWAVLDCWENEPAPRETLIRHPGLAIGTPHIAGHSLDGKARNTLFAYQALCRWLGVEPEWRPDPLLPPPPEYVIEPSPDPWLTLHRVARTLYPIRRDHEAVRSWAVLDATERAARFSAFRRHYPTRRSWQKARILLPGAVEPTIGLARAIGIGPSLRPN
ncbi:MAG: 4-phosphoerythronate dehydrogenase [Mariprofundaceae bacterium]